MAISVLGPMQAHDWLSPVHCHPGLCMHDSETVLDLKATITCSNNILSSIDIQIMMKW